MSVYRILFTVLSCAFALLASVASPASDQIVLRSDAITVTISTKTAGVVSIDNNASDESHPVRADSCRIETDGGVVDLGSAKWKTAAADRRSCTFVTQANGLYVTRVYTIYPGRGYFDRSLTVSNRGGSAVLLKRITDADLEFASSFLSADYHTDNTDYANSVNVFLRAPRGTLCVGLTYPYFTSHSTRTHASLSYEPNYRLKPGETLDLPTAFCAASERTGYKLRKQIDTIKPRILTTAQEIMDIAEAGAMQRVVEDYVRQEPLPAPGYVVALDAWWALNSLDRKMGEKEVESYNGVISKVKQAGCIDLLLPAACWIGIQQFAQESPEICGIGDDAVFPINPYVRTVVDRIKAAGLLTACYCQGNIPQGGGYRADKPEWKIEPGSGYNCHANPEYEDWFYRLISNTIDTCGLSRFSWDYNWMRERPVVCNNTRHGHEPGNVEFAQYRNVTSVVQRLRKRYPNIQLCAFWGLKEGNPWSLKGISSQENFYENHSAAYNPPDLSSADDLRFQHWYNHNYRFLPTYTNMAQINFAKEAKGNLYSILSCLSASTHASVCDWVQFDTQEEADKIFGPLRYWKKWASEHYSFLRDRVDLFGQPCRKDGIDGTAHILGDRGFIFIFNPTSGAHWGSIPLNELIGLEKGARYSLDEISTGQPKRMAVLSRGDALLFQIQPNSAMLVELKPARGPLSRTTAPQGVLVQQAFNR